MKIKVGEQEYPFPEIDTITYREAAIVKKLVGLRLGEFAEAFENGDTDMMVGLAAIAIHRYNGHVELDYIFDLKLDEITFVMEPEDSELPPTSAPASSSNGSSTESASGGSDTSGTQVSSDQKQEA